LEIANLKPHFRRVFVWQSEQLRVYLLAMTPGLTCMKGDLNTAGQCINKF
jgi:hypothetical protein